MAYYDENKRVWRESFGVAGKRYARVLLDDKGLRITDPRAKTKAEKAEKRARDQVLKDVKKAAELAAAEAAEHEVQEAAPDDDALRYCFNTVALSFVRTKRGRHRQNLQDHVSRLARVPFTDPPEVEPAEDAMEAEADGEPIIPPETDIRTLTDPQLEIVLTRLYRLRVLVRKRAGPLSEARWDIPKHPAGTRPLCLSDRTVHHYMKTVGYVLRHAVKSGLITRMPLMPVAEVAKREPTPIEPDDLKRLLDTDGPAHIKAGVALSFAFGLRRGEVWGLRRSWLDLRPGQETLRLPWHANKNNKDEPLPIPPSALVLLRELRAEAERAGRDHLLVYAHGKDGTPKPIKCGRTAWRTLMRRAGVSPKRWVDLRAGFASACFEAGLDALLVRDLMRHADIKTTMLYSKAAERRRRPGIARVDAFVVSGCVGGKRRPVRSVMPFSVRPPTFSPVWTKGRPFLRR